MKLLAEYINDLQELQGVSFEEYQENKLIRKAVERTLHTSIEACLDIGHHIIAVERFRSPTDNSDVFAVLGEQAILPRDLVPKLVNMARFRNILVHEYTHIDDGIVYNILSQQMDDFDEFARAIAAYGERRRDEM